MRLCDSVTRSQSQAAWVRLPNSVVRDRQLSAAALVLVAYRATFAGAFAINITALLRNPIVRGPGFGRNVVKQALREGRKAGYLDRLQAPSSGRATFGLAREKLTLPPCRASGKAGRMFYRKWLDAQLTRDEMAAYLYFRAGTGNGPIAYAAELAERFGWSRPTTGKIIKALIRLGLVAKHEMRAANGRIQGIGYQALPPHLWQAEPLSKSRTTKNRPTKNRPTYVSNPLHVLPSEEPSLRTKGHYAFAAQNASCASEDDLEDRAFEAPNLLGWAADDELAEKAALLDSAPPEKVAAIAALVSDAKLASHIRTATANRVSAEILMPAGLYAVRWLAATMLADDPEDCNDDGPTPAEPLDVVLDAMRARVGWQPGTWLNSLALIGKRMAGAAYAGSRTEIFARH